MLRCMRTETEAERQGGTHFKSQHWGGGSREDEKLSHAQLLVQCISSQARIHETLKQRKREETSLILVSLGGILFRFCEGLISRKTNLVR